MLNMKLLEVVTQLSIYPKELISQYPEGVSYFDLSYHGSCFIWFNKFKPILNTVVCKMGFPKELHKRLVVQNSLYGDITNLDCECS